ncbi:MAG: protein translocase subunit SecD [Elusimicrobia bacterium]|nr:protein translocase subunit SecD [Elusimicrobiota bacterium]MDE2424872.1 protein translocase subunit SecD [Elusimicrobiota bacterium]
MSKFQMKWAGVVALLALAVALLYPTVNWYMLAPSERAQLEAQRSRPKWLLNLGLDLRGGTYLLMELDVSKLDAKADINDAIQRAIEIIRNRVDQFGVAEPLIAKQGDRWIVVQLPGITNSAQAKELIGKTALLQFRMVDSSDAAQKALAKISELPDPFVGNRASAAAAKLVPKGLELFKGKDGSFYLLSADVPLTGAQLETARVDTGGNYGMPEVAFKFKPEAATKFSNLTAANIGKDMAIVLDDVVYSAPVIKGRISGGSGVIEGQFSIDDAKDLAIVLRAGALPAPVRVIEERTIGPTVGEDSIKAGVRATLIAGAFIFIFMAFYYHLAGVVADIALALNLIFLLACMSYFGSTLTLPGIAGIVLTIAMAVDYNVLVFERIREELALGKPVRIALDHGFDRAFTAIFDSNITTLISSVFLFQFGSGPIKGFAVTLVLGLAIAMFTAVWLTRLIFQSYLQNRDITTISIG